METRIAELESRVAFQEHTLNELNDVIVDQSARIDQLTRSIEQMKSQMRSLASNDVVSESAEPPPPHY